MNTISLQKVSDNTLCSTSPYEPLRSCRRPFASPGRHVKTIERTQGRIEAAWKYGFNPFGMRITVNFASQGDETIQLTLNGSFVDAIDTFGAAKKKARAITDELLKPIDIAAWPIKEGQHPPAALCRDHSPQAPLNGANAVAHRGSARGSPLCSHSWAAALVCISSTPGIGAGGLSTSRSAPRPSLILSVIEFIRVLCLTQEEFDRRYNYRPISAFSWVW